MKRFSEYITEQEGDMATKGKRGVKISASDKSTSNAKSSKKAKNKKNKKIKQGGKDLHLLPQITVG